MQRLTQHEKCSKYPSMLKAHCSHCQGTERGTSDNPRYSLKESRYHGSPIVEVLANGGSIHPWDKHFQFGLRKAELLLACSPLLKEFWQSSEDEKRSFKSRVVEDRSRGFSIQIYVQLHEDFENSYGTKVERPWLFLRALPPDNYDVGLGTAKCRAICEVQEDLKLWLRRHGIPDQ
jgi:hypothetical protein